MSTLSQAQAAIAQVRLAITYQPPGQLKPDPKNPRQHSTAQIKKLARSMQAFGFIMPILVDPSSRVNRWPCPAARRKVLRRGPHDQCRTP